jgi:predicted SAM-dependent methyltransferase
MEQHFVGIGQVYLIGYLNSSVFDGKNTTVVFDGAVFPDKHTGHIFVVSEYVKPCCSCDQYGQAIGKCSCGECISVSTQFLIPDLSSDCKNKEGHLSEEQIGLFQGFHTEKKTPLKLHIGCGNRLLPEPWINIDKDELLHLSIHTHKGDILDLKNIVDDTGRYSIKDNSCEEAYVSHILDHLSRNQELDKALDELYRVLKPGGILRVAVSDFEKTVKMYNEGIDLERLWGAIVGGHKTSYDRHGVAFDFNVLKRYLENHGFVDVKRYQWQDFLPKDFQDNSCAAVPKYDLDGYLMSLNVICMKVILPKE